MAIFAVTNQKGGVGKTTTAVNLSAALSAMRYHVLLVDLDPQCNATVGSGVIVDKAAGSLSEVLLGQASIQSAIQSTNYGYHILPSNHRLTAAEVGLVGKKDKEKHLKNLLAKVKKIYHYIIIDCPPTLNILTINALVAANEVIIPVQCEYYALEGLAKLLKTIDASLSESVSGISKSRMPSSSNGLLPSAFLLTSCMFFFTFNHRDHLILR